MITTEIQTAHIPSIYKRFTDIIGDKHWKDRVALLKQEIKGNRFLADYNQSENSIAFQLEYLRELTAKFGNIPSGEINNPDIFPAVRFAAQVLSIMDISTKEFAEQLKRRIHGALKNPNDMRGLCLELNVATHFVRRNLNISWPEMTGIGTFDLFIEELGPKGLEIECKSISTDKGRKVHGREVLEFYNLLWPHLEAIKKGLHTGLSVVLTVPERLPSKYESRKTLAKQVIKQIICGQSVTLSDGSNLKITEFDVNRLGYIQKISNPKKIRAAFDEVTETQNREVMVVGTKAGGALALVVQSAKDDKPMKAIFDTLSNSAKKQLSGTRGGMFLAELHGIDGEQLISIASQDKDPTQQQTLLQLGSNEFLSTTDREHVIGVGFLSKSDFMPAQNGIVNSGGISYIFLNRKSSLWSDDFNGLFS